MAVLLFSGSHTVIVHLELRCTTNQIVKRTKQHHKGGGHLNLFRNIIMVGSQNQFVWEKIVDLIMKISQSSFFKRIIKKEKNPCLM